MRKKGRYIRKIDRKKISGASVIALMTFITGAAFFAMGMYLTVYAGAEDALVAAALGWIALFVFILGIVLEIFNFKIKERFLLLDKWGLALNIIMAIGIIAVYVWGILS